MTQITNEFKKTLSGDKEEQFEKVRELFTETRKDIIKGEGTCNDEELILLMCKELKLDYEMYLALSVSLFI